MRRGEGNQALFGLLMDRKDVNRMSLCLIDGGKSRYQIIVAADAGAAVRCAAGELAKYLAAMGGAAIPVRTDDTPACPWELVVGRTNRLGAPRDAVLKNDGDLL